MAEVASYEYELRQGETVVSTGQLLLEQPPQPGERLILNGRYVDVVDVIAASGTPRLILAAD